MLVVRLRQNRDDSGAALIAVVVVMLVGFIIAATVAASVLFTVSANAGNASTTQAFIAAESGRDAALAEIASGCSTGNFPVTSSGDLTYSATIAVTDGNEPTAPDYTGVAPGCPTQDTKYVVITSTGTGRDGSTTTIDAVYPWIVSWEQQAGGVLAYFGGSVSSTVSNYTGDLVVRTGNYTCNNEGTINGDLYVTRGSVNLSRDCTVNGDIWVRDDVNASSQLVEVTGQVKAGGNATFTSNGSVIGVPPAELEAGDVTSGDIEAGGDITLSNTGSTNGRVYGDLIAGGTTTVGNKWTVAGTDTEGTTIPPFSPELEFIRSITSWIDLDDASGWNIAAPINACALTPSELLSQLTTGGSDPIALDFRGCSSTHTNITLSGTATNTVTKDAVFLAPAGKRMNINLDANLSGGKQLIFLHADASRDLNAGETQPDCGTGNQKDTFNLGNGRDVTDVKIMVYSPCGLTGTVHESFTGQLYSNDTNNMTFGTGASYTCALMSWPDAFEKLGCKVRGEGEDVVLETVLVQRLGDRLSQSER